MMLHRLAGALGHRVRQPVLLGRAGLLEAVLEHLADAADREQRVADLVRHRGGEVRLDRVRALQLVDQLGVASARPATCTRPWAMRTDDVDVVDPSGKRADLNTLERAAADEHQIERVRDRPSGGNNGAGRARRRRGVSQRAASSSARRNGRSISRLSTTPASRCDLGERPRRDGAEGLARGIEHPGAGGRAAERVHRDQAKGIEHRVHRCRR